MLEYINEVDTELFLYLNSFHSPFWDFLMIKITNSKTWIPLYIAIIALLIYKYRVNGFKLVVIILLLIGFNDQVSSRLAKPGFKRLRPSHNIELQEKIHLAKGKGGTYGYFSSHASNTFALATFLILMFAKRYKWLWLFLPWAVIVSYSRIYIGVHYPADILTGVVFGCTSAWALYRLYKQRLISWVS